MPPITKNLIIINVLMFLSAIVGERNGFDLNDALGLHFFLADDFQIYQLVTYMFMHGGWSHIIFNMFALWMFGRTMEQVWGYKRFLTFYLVCGIGAGLIQEISQGVSYIIQGLGDYELATVDGNVMSMGTYLNSWTTIGASGATYAILLGFGMTFPEERILLLIPPIPIKAKYFVLGYIAIELFSALGQRGDGVAHFAHLGGMLFGYFLIKYWKKIDKKNNNSFMGWNNYKPQQKKESLWNKIKNKAKQNKKNNFEKRTIDYDFNKNRKEKLDEIDTILEKIKKSGYDSLSDIEKKKLFDAGKK